MQQQFTPDTSRAAQFPLYQRDSFQARVCHWMRSFFGEEIQTDPVEHNHRFLMESVKFFRMCGGTQEQAQALLQRAYDEQGCDPGELMVALAASANAQGIDLVERKERVLCGLRDRLRRWPIFSQGDRLRVRVDVDVSTGFGDSEPEPSAWFNLAQKAYQEHTPK